MFPVFLADFLYGFLIFSDFFPNSDFLLQSSFKFFFCLWIFPDFFPDFFRIFQLFLVWILFSEITWSLSFFNSLLLIPIFHYFFKIILSRSGTYELKSCLYKFSISWDSLHSPLCPILPLFVSLWNIRSEIKIKAQDWKI